MERKTIKIGDRVVRSKGDYVVGRTGVVVSEDHIKARRQIKWDSAPTTWVSMSALELESIPYRIEPGREDKTPAGYFKWVNAKYTRL